MNEEEINPFLGFDEFVKEHQIKDEELGVAFAAWLSKTGWDGDYEVVQ